MQKTKKDIPRIFLIPKNNDKEKIIKKCTGFFRYIRGDWYIQYLDKIRETHLPSTFWDIPRISHIPKKQRNSMYRKFYGISQGYPISQKNRKFLCTGFFLVYTMGYPISQKIESFYVPDFFWDIPGISHIPKIRNFVCTGFFLGYPIYQYFLKLCTPGA